VKLISAALVCLLAEAGSVAPAANTWRLDYYLSGVKSGEVFSVD
jgi:hypothetical protein